MGLGSQSTAVDVRKESDFASRFESKKMISCDFRVELRSIEIWSIWLPAFPW